jgi:hypothetical protein
MHFAFLLQQLSDSDSDSEEVQSEDWSSEMSQSPSEGGFGAVVKPHRRAIPSDSEDSGSDREVKNQDDSFNGSSAQSEQRAKDGVTDGVGSAPACFDTGTLLRFISEKDRAVQGPLSHIWCLPM